MPVTISSFFIFVRFCSSYLHHNYIPGHEDIACAKPQYGLQDLQGMHGDCTQRVRSDCSRPCGGGLRTRNRVIEAPRLMEFDVKFFAHLSNMLQVPKNDIDDDTAHHNTYAAGFGWRLKPEMVAIHFVEL